MLSQHSTHLAVALRVVRALLPHGGPGFLLCVRE